MTNNIVSVAVTQNVAPAPSTLQRTGAMISQGATTLAANARQLLTQASDLTAILKGALAISTLAWSGGVVTVTTVAPHGFTISDTLPITISGATPAGYNGTFTGTVTGASTFTYPLVSNPGAETVPGVYTPEDVAELLAMVTTFFAQGSSQSVYVVELGAGNAADGVTALAAYIVANPAVFYAYLLPRYWAAEATFLSFVAGFENATSKTYFFVTMALGNYASYTALMKCVQGMVEAPTIPSTEFSLAAWFWNWLHYNPSSTNKVTPALATYLFGVTPYPLSGNGTTLAALKAAGVNYVGTGANGGISNAVLFWGTTMDKHDATYWYSVDWVQINIDQALEAVVINGSNNPINPLYYNQDGINRLQAVAAGVLASGVSFGLVLGNVVQTQLSAANFTAALQSGQFAGQAVINADPFVAYSAENPNDYATGTYNGLSAVYVPARGFAAIVFNLNVSNFVAQ